MRWNKLGLVFSLEDKASSSHRRAMVPTPLLIDNDTIRIYITICDDNNIGRPHYIDVSAHDPKKILAISDGPVMDVGEPCTFDEHGIVLSQVIRDIDSSRLLMYYSGFERGGNVPYKIFTGLAISDDGGENFTRYSRAPILDRSDKELLFRCAPFVIKTDAVYRMWYTAGSDWEFLNGKKVPRYFIKYIESDNGIDWPSEGKSVLELGPDEHGIGRAWIEFDEDDTYHLYYSVRKISIGAYRLGYATSVDGLMWSRRDAEFGLTCTLDSFDSDAISYSAIISVHGRKFCFYNGNNFGGDGFAVAELIA